jgi:hypothetical protein
MHDNIAIALSNTKYSLCSGLPVNTTRKNPIKANIAINANKCATII